MLTEVQIKQGRLAEVAATKRDGGARTEFAVRVAAGVLLAC